MLPSHPSLGKCLTQNNLEARVNDRYSHSTNLNSSGETVRESRTLPPAETSVRLPGEPYRAPSEARDRKHYVFVFDTVRRGASMTEISREQRQALQRAAEYIPGWDTFRRLCSIDIREVSAAEPEIHRNTRVVEL